MTHSEAWYSASKSEFVSSTHESITGTLSQNALRDGWDVPPDQVKEWENSVKFLQSALSSCDPELGEVLDVILEYNFRRRGLRMDCILLAPGAVVIIEFKRSSLGTADRDQVTNYCINLVEFHEETRKRCAQDDVIVVPILAMTGKAAQPARTDSVIFHGAPWNQILEEPIECDARSLSDALFKVL